MSDCALLELAAGQDGLPAQQYALLVMLARLSVDGRVTISKIDLGARVGLKERQTYTVLQFLAARGLITINHNAGEGAGRLPSTYSLLATGSALPIAPMQHVADCLNATGNQVPIAAQPIGNVLPIAPRQQTADCPGIGPPKENNQTPRELYPEPLELEAAVAAAPRARPPADRVVEAIASPLLDPSKSLRLVETSTVVAKWIEAGADLELDVIPTVSRLIARRVEPVRTWAYFTSAVREAAAERLAPVTPIQPAEAFDGQRPQPYARAAGGRPRSVLAAMASDLSRFSGK